MKQIKIQVTLDMASLVEEYQRLWAEGKTKVAKKQKLDE